MLKVRIPIPAQLTDHLLCVRKSLSGPVSLVVKKLLDQRFSNFFFFFKPQNLKKERKKDPSNLMGKPNIGNSKIGAALVEMG